jgi:hypothetical protein
MITRHLADLLYHNECVIVPGLGGFIKAFNPARIIHTTHHFFPPSGSIAFNAGLSGNDGLLANYIASVENKSYREAIGEIHLWVEKCHETLKRGDNLLLEGIGELFLNASGRIEFKPSTATNFNADAFGLPVFFATVADSEPTAIPEVQPRRRANSSSKLHRLVPETLKWAAVLAPFIGFALWGSLNGNFINNYVHNYTGMYSWVRSTPGKTAPVSINSLPATVKETTPEPMQSPAGILAESNISYNPNKVSHSELAKHNIVITEPAQVVEAQTTLTGQKYHVIGGAFRDHNNALKLIAILREQGYPAAVVDTTPGGLYVVSMKGFNDYSEATTQLEEIKNAGFSGSWILRKGRI